MNQGLIWPNKLLYIHLTTNIMKYLLNTNKFYYINYTCAKKLIIKKIIIKPKILD
jgi:hypothetical protein